MCHMLEGSSGGAVTTRLQKLRTDLTLEGSSIFHTLLLLMPYLVCIWHVSSYIILGNKVLPCLPFQLSTAVWVILSIMMQHNSIHSSAPPSKTCENSLAFTCSNTNMLTNKTRSTKPKCKKHGKCVQQAHNGVLLPQTRRITMHTKDWTTTPACFNVLKKASHSRSCLRQLV